MQFSNSELSFMNMAASVAKRSILRIRVGAVVTKRRHIVSMGYNQKKTHPLIHKFPYDPHVGLHAEMDACFGIDTDMLSGSTIYIARLLRNNKTALSKPCEGCQALLKYFGIKNIIYSTDNGFGKITIRNGKLKCLLPS